MPRHHFLYESFNEIIKKLFEGGIIKTFIEPYYLIRNTQGKKQPEVLTLDHLMIGFQLWLFFLVVATLGFFIEFLIRSVRRKFKAPRKKKQKINPKIEIQLDRKCLAQL